MSRQSKLTADDKLNMLKLYYGDSGDSNAGTPHSITYIASQYNISTSYAGQVIKNTCMKYHNDIQEMKKKNIPGSEIMRSLGLGLYLYTCINMNIY